MTMASSSRRSSSPFNCRRVSSSPYSSTSSSSSIFNGRLANRSCSSSASSFFGSGNGYGVRSRAPSHARIDSACIGSKICGSGISAEYACGDDLTGELLADAPRSGDSISVTIRFRPLSEREFQRGDEIAWHPDGDKIVRSEYNTESAYAFDKVFGPSASSDEVYEVAAGSVVKAAMEGVNGTVFAYGVTSSGKTHTMHGGQNSPGIIQLAIKDVFSIIQDTPGREFLLRVSYIEIYNEVINDLLDPTCQNLRVREDVQGTYVEGIKEEVVLSPGHALSFIAAGEEHRHVGSNNFNLLSSRSHTIFTLMIESSAHGDEYDGVIFSQLNLIDLAGSESSKTETTGLRRKEGSYINKSLLTLGTVIGKLSEGRASHIPYRDSKLTRLLQSSLSGHGHVSLICTVTPASSSMEETHNTLKFANRAKRVEIFASLNKIIDEKSLIKKYQKEISSLKQELDHLKKGVITNASHNEILSLKQQLEEGQVKMQSRLEEEEEAKSALMSRIQRLTKLILVSTKNNIPGCLGDSSLQQSFSIGEGDKLDTQCNSSLHDDSDSLGEALLPHTVAPLEQSSDIGQVSAVQRIESMPIDSTTIGENTNERGMPISDEMDLLVEQVKMLAGEIALGTSTLKRLSEQSTNGSECSKTQVQTIEHDIQEKQTQIRALEKRITESGVASLANTSIADMQQAILRMMTRCNEKAFDLEIKSADNRILQEQLQNKCREADELKEKLDILQKNFNSLNKCPPLQDQYVSRDYVDEMKIKIHCQEKENDRLKLEHIQLSEDYSGLCVQNQKLSEESSYAKELASAAAVELKNLTDQITKLSLQNAMVEKELSATRELAHSRALQNGNGSHRRHNDGIRSLRRVHASGRGNEADGNSFDDFDTWTLGCEDLKVELQTRKQRETALEAVLAQSEIIEDGYRKKIEDAKKRETALENDLANMWVLVAQLKKHTTSPSHDTVEEKWIQQNEIVDNLKSFDFVNSDSDSKEDCLDLLKPVSETEEALVVRLKARIQDMKERDLEARRGNGDNPFNVLFE